MGLTTEHSGKGRELDWLGLDWRDNLGYFSTAGVGPIPVALAQSTEELHDLFERVMTLRVVDDARAVSPDATNIGDWLEVARRGFFAFDWNRHRSAYVLVAQPNVPVKLESITDPTLQGVARRARLDVDIPGLMVWQRAPAHARS